MFGSGFGSRWPNRRKQNNLSPPVPPPAQVTPTPAPAPPAPAPPARVVTPQYHNPIPSPPLSNDGRFGIAVVGRFKDWEWGQYPDEAYMAAALEGLGVRVWRVDQDENIPPIKGADAALFTGHPRSFLRLGAWAKTHLTCLWTLDWLPDFPDRQRTIDVAREATLFLSSDRYGWSSVGVTNHDYLPGACETRTAPFSPAPSVSCAFMGSLYNDRRKEIARIVRKYEGVVKESAGSWIYGEDLSRFVQNVKVVIGDNARNDVDGYWSTRNYIIPGAGGFLLTRTVPGLGQQFTVGKHLATYDSVESLEENLKKWLDDEPGREEIRRAGHDYVRAEHTWAHRARALMVHLANKIRELSPVTGK